MSRLQTYIAELKEEITTGNVGGLSGADITPETNGLKKLKMQKRKKKKLKNTPTILPHLEIQK